MQSSRSETMASAGVLILRVGTGALLMTHGWGKLQMLISGDASKFPDPLGVGNMPSLVMAVGAEFVCALLVAVGFFTRFAAIPPAIAMGVAAFIVHQSDPWTMSEAAKLFGEGKVKSAASKEPALLFLIPFVSLMFLGGGRFSLDAILLNRKKTSAATST